MTVRRFPMNVSFALLAALMVPCGLQTLLSAEEPDIVELSQRNPRQSWGANNLHALKRRPRFLS